MYYIFPNFTMYKFRQYYRQPPQQGDSSTWVINREYVTQLNTTGLLVCDNVFHTLRQPAYLNPGSNGTIINNVVYNTRGYVVDRSDFLFLGNSWGFRKMQ